MDAFIVRLHRDLPSGPGPDDCHGTVVHVPSGHSQAIRNCAELIEALNWMAHGDPTAPRPASAVPGAGRDAVVALD
jgi:hypothetical protein